MIAAITNLSTQSDMNSGLTLSIASIAAAHGAIRVTGPSPRVKTAKDASDKAAATSGTTSALAYGVTFITIPIRNQNAG